MNEEVIDEYNSVEEYNEALLHLEDGVTTETITPLTEEEEELLEETHQEIPVNSETLLIDESTTRFSSAIWYENIQKKTIILAGIGGIGSWTSLLLARMKPKALYIYDNDRVEAVNMSGQLYGQNDLGKYKVSAIADIIRNYANYGSIFAIPERFTCNSDSADIMICGFDNMKARKTFYNKWKSHVDSKSDDEKANCLFLDGRLSAEEFQVLCIVGDDVYNMGRYERDFLFSDSMADETVCSYKQTTFCASMIASCIVNLFVNFCANEVGAYRDLPFFNTYNAETMYFKTEA